MEYGAWSMENGPPFPAMCISWAGYWIRGSCVGHTFLLARKDREYQVSRYGVAWGRLITRDLPSRQIKGSSYCFLFIFILIRFYFRLPHQGRILYSFLLQPNSLCAQCPQFSRLNIANGRGANHIDIVICHPSPLFQIRTVVS